MACDQRLKNIHQKLLMDISDYVTPNGPVHESITTMIKVHVPPGKVEGKSLIKQFEELARKGKLKPGKYDILEEICRRSGNEDLVDLINSAKEEMNKVQTTSQEPGPSTSNNTVVTSTNNNKRSAQDIVVSDSLKRPRLDLADDSSKYYSKRDKKGLLLILNSTSNRDGTDIDANNLKQFFADELRYTVYDPRSQVEDDLTTQQLDTCLREVKNHMNGELGRQFHSFICVILSHGNEKGIKTKDGFKETENIRREFNNDHIPNFSGRPKVFLIQACRGSAVQGSVQTDLSDEETETPTQNDVDESDVIVNVPTDADTLLAFSTTPGNRSFRRLGVGSWFIKECVDIFRQNYRIEHLEEMLITVRGNVATNWQRSDGGKQMPCVWSTLTRRLML